MTRSTVSVKREHGEQHQGDCTDYCQSNTHTAKNYTPREVGLAN